MSDNHTELVTVTIDISAPPEEVQAVQDVLTSAGIANVEVNAGYFRKSDIPDLPWIIIIAGAPITAFLAALAKAAGESVGKAAGEDMYPALTRLVTALWNARRMFSGSHGMIELRDEPTGRGIWLEEDLPESAYRELARLDMSQFEGKRGDLYYDRKLGKWTTPR